MIVSEQRLFVEQLSMPLSMATSDKHQIYQKSDLPPNNVDDRQE